MADYYLKKGDIGNPLIAVLSDANGPVDLTGLTIRFKMRPRTTLVTKVDGPAVPDPDQSANPGRVSYSWAEGDVDSAGRFVGEFIIDDFGGATFPNGNRYIEIEIGEGVPDIEE